MPPVEDDELEEVGAEEAPQRPARERSASGRRGSALAARPQTPRAAPRPYSDYAAEYAYVFSDLRRVGAVVGLLLLALIVLSFVLPR